MDDSYVLKKTKLSSLLKVIIRDFCLIGPRKQNTGDVLFEPVAQPQEITLDYDITSNTLKEFFFPRREIIFSYRRNAGGSFEVIPYPHRTSGTNVFFAVRSCDIRAVKFQDDFFIREPQDALYRRKRDDTVLISLACNKPPRRSCFCNHTGSGPFLEKGSGFDLQLIDLGEDYLVEVGTEKGRDLILRYRRYFAAAEKRDVIKKASLRGKCLKGLSRKYDFLNIHNKIKNLKLYKLWDDLGRRCTNCGGCEFICPTCFCFYTQDIEYSKNKGERIRAWDSCAFSGYSRIAGNINPYEKNSQRISRRFFCKLYNCYKWFKTFACTGCGRCSFVCPVNLDMESFISSLMKSNTYKPLLKEL